MSLILANVFNEGDEVIIKIYNGEVVEEKSFKTHDEAVNFLVKNNFIIKTESIDNSLNMYSMWFEGRDFGKLPY